MKLIATCIAALLLLTGCNVSFSSGEKNSGTPESTAGSPEQQKEAEAAARAYLSMIDQKEYEKTWELTGPALRSQSSKFAWVNTLKMTRKAFDPGKKRNLEGFGFSKQIDPSVPVGEYVLVQFNDITGSVTTTEKVVMQKDQSKWKIIGYFIYKKSQFRAGT